MGGQEAKKGNKHICVGLLAHVDAGKTTLAERILFETGSIRRLGRVDHGDAFLDTEDMEKARGITIFSKQARLTLAPYEITLLDTPGHVDFSAEMERTLSVLDYAVLVVSGADGVQGHVETLWRLLGRYGIPVFIFVNKMDQEGTDPVRLTALLQERLDKRCVDFSPLYGAYGKDGKVIQKAPACREEVPEEFWENLAVCREELLEKYLEGGTVTGEDIQGLIAEREVFPCFFGSALKGFGVTAFLQGLSDFMRPVRYETEFGARVFKITRDGQGNRLTHMKITGGSLKAKALLTNRQQNMPNRQKSIPGEVVWEEKADRLRLYSGAAFETVQEVQAGEICAVSGLTQTFAGQGLGIETQALQPLLEPVLTYQIMLPEGCDIHGSYKKLKQLEEEEPELSIVWREEVRQIHAQVMGEVQIEILKNQMQERLGFPVSFGEGSIVYKETIADTAEGVGHFEPLRHYAEVHLLLEPLQPGEGLVLDTACSEDVLDRNWQRLVLSHLEEKKHRGVLMGAEITDMKITLATGRAHLKHTVGGDFREATFRALRNGLMQAQSVLLEPVYRFLLEVPAENVGRAMTDIQKMCGSCGQPQTEGEFCILTGRAPVATMGGYQKEVTAYTKGRGKLSCTLQGYEPCHNSEEVIALSGYDPEADLENPAGSVFCAHGAGFVVPWDQVAQYMHLESCLNREAGEGEVPKGTQEAYAGRAGHKVGLPEGVTNEELEEIFARTFFANQKERAGYKKKRAETAPATKKWTKEQGETQPSGSGMGNLRDKKDGEPEEYLLVDGYNIIFAWEDLRELSETNMEGARNRLMDILSNYQGFRRCVVILVFDAYRVEGGQGSVSKYHNIDVVFTREAETADQYIEKTAHRLGRSHHVTVATSDALEQVIIYGQGARRMSARELAKEVAQTQAQIREVWKQKRSDGKNYLFDHLPEEMNRLMEEVRLGKRQL